MNEMDEVKDLTHRQFLVNLQLEYLTHKLRAMVYQEETYARVAADIAEKKKRKVVDLGGKFNIPTIFSHESTMEAFISQYFWQPYGLPNLQYKDEEQRRVQGNYDAWYLLFRNNKIKYHGVCAEVVSNNPSKGIVKIRTEKEVTVVNYIDITLMNEYKWK